MEDKNWREPLDEHLLGCRARARRIELDRLQVGDVCERVFYGMHRVMLLERFDVSYRNILWVRWEKGKQTWMSRRSNRQSSMVKVSARFGPRKIERNFPPNMRIRGDWIASAYS